MSHEAALNLVEFTRRYHRAIEELLGTLPREKLPHHGEETRIVTTLQASDAVITFYLPESDVVAPKPGHSLYDLSQHSANRVCQSLSVRHLQVGAPGIGEPWDHRPLIRSDEEPIPDLNAPWIQEDVRQAVGSGNLRNLQGLTIWPPVQVTDGTIAHVLPGRLKIWSPVFHFEGLGLRRLFLWTHADFWWRLEGIGLEPDLAEAVAEADILALETLTREAGVFGPEMARSDAVGQAADVLEEYCDQLISLLDSRGENEEEIHQWLYDTRHRVFLDPHARQIWSKLPFGSKTSDFVVRRADDTYRLIEIESASQRILKASDSEPTAEFNHARQQVRDWKRYIRHNLSTVRNELGLDGIDDPAGAVVAGRSSELDSKAAQQRWSDLKTGDMELLTYDELCDSVRALAAQLRALF